jgi:hypothetical protein
MLHVLNHTTVGYVWRGIICIVVVASTALNLGLTMYLFVGWYSMVLYVVWWLVYHCRVLGFGVVSIIGWLVGLRTLDISGL